MLSAVFYCEFDNIAGPQLLFQAPENFISHELFDAISDYIILDKALCRKVITIFPMQYILVGYPICIEDDKYHRNSLFFNIGFLFQSHADTLPYHSTLKKLGSILESMEKEMSFLSTPASKASLQFILPQILLHLNQSGSCSLAVENNYMIHLKLFLTLTDPPQVHDHQVPVAIRDLSALLRNHAEWDLALQQVIRHIDGVNFVKRISLESKIEIAIVKKCLRQLLYYQSITMVDIFLYANSYITTKEMSRFAKDTILQKECCEYVVKEGHNLPRFSNVFALYCSIQPGLHVADFCVLYGKSMSNIDVRRFFTFGVIHGFLRRIYRYPVRTRTSRRVPKTSMFLPTNLASVNGPSASSRALAAASVRQASREVEVLSMMNGKHNTDEICCKYMIDYKAVEKIVAKDESCFVVHKIN